MYLLSNLNIVYFLYKKKSIRKWDEMNKEICKSHQFVINDKKVMVYPSVDSDRPVVYLNTFAEEGI